MSFWSDIVHDISLGITAAAGGGPGVITNTTAATPQQLAGEAPGIGLVEGIWTQLTDGRMWRSLGWLILGIVLMLAGAAWWIGPSAARRSPLGVAAEQLS